MSSLRTQPRSRDPFGFAVLASLRLVLELFVVEKQLFAGCEDEVCTTIHTLQNLVLEFHWKRHSHSPTLRNTQDPNREGSGSQRGQEIFSPPCISPVGSARHAVVHRLDHCLTARQKTNGTSKWMRWAVSVADTALPFFSPALFELFFGCAYAPALLSRASFLQASGRTSDVLLP